MEIINRNKYSKKKENIIILASAGISIRNLLLDSSLKELKKINEKYNIIIITNEVYLSTYKNVFEFIPLYKLNRNIVNYILHFISRLLFDKVYQTNTKNILIDNPFSTSFKSNLYKYFYAITPKSKFIYSSIRHIHDVFTKINYRRIRSKLKKLNPSYLFSLNPLSKEEYPYMLFAKSITKTFGVFKSFDNISSDGYVPCLPNQLFVWNNLMKEDAVKAYQLDNKKIIPVGSPQYDGIKNYSNTERNNERKILYCSNSPNIYKYDPENIKFLLNLSKKNNFKIILRLHQFDTYSRWENIINNKDLIVYRNEQFRTANDRVACKNHNRSLHKQIIESSVVVCSYSTIIFDSLARARPVINLGFDMEDVSFKYSIRRADKFEHIIPFLNLNCVDNVHSQAQLIKSILLRLDNYFSKEEQTERKEFLMEYLGANFKANTILNILNSLNCK